VKHLSIALLLSAVLFAPCDARTRAYSQYVRPAAGTPTFIINFIATGPNQSGVPCFNCVGGASGLTIGLPVPNNVVPANYYWQYNISWTNVSFKGTCKVTLEIVGGGKVLDNTSANVPGISSAGSYDWAFSRLHPTYTGSATATGKVKCGTATQKTSAMMLFE